MIIPPNENSEALDSNLKFTESGDGSWFVAWGTCADYYYDGDAMVSDDTGINEEACLQTIVESDSSETVKFYWKVSCEDANDYLRFYIDGTLQDSISGEQDWQQKSYSISSGIHTLKWVYDDGGGSSGDDCGWVDFVQWSGPSPEQDPSDWQTINYKHDLYGRRIEKKVDGYSTRYVYDGPHVIAEYDGNNNLLRKYIYGPGIDQPVCMIEEAESETYYYHYDGLGSVVALSDSSGDTVQTYEYSAYGQVAVEDPNHTNPYMFAGRRFDIEIGLYYNRARYYNPYTGRFLQADPIGYKAGMNMYAYCENNPIIHIDPTGLEYVFYKVTGNIMVLPWRTDPEELSMIKNFEYYLRQFGFEEMLSLVAYVSPNLGEAYEILPTVGLQAGMVTAYLYAAAEVIERLPGLVKTDTSLYRGFFEVREVILSDDLLTVVSNTLCWIEVAGIRGANDNYKGYEDPFGYWSDNDAFHAAVRGMNFFEDWFYYGAEVPDSWYDPLYGGWDIFLGPYYTGGITFEEAIVIPGEVFYDNED